MEYYANGVKLPAPTDLSVGRTKIWSDNTGRSVTAKMIGDIIAKKKKFSITWEMITESQLKIIEDNLSTVAHPFVDFRIQNEETQEDAYNLKIYDGTLQCQMANFLYKGEVTYLKVTDELVEQ